MYFLLHFLHTASIPPLLLPTCAYIAGIWLQYTLSYNFIFASVITSCMLFFCFVMKKLNNKIQFKFLKRIITLFLFFTFGSFLLKRQINEHNHLYDILRNKPLVITGTIIDKGWTDKNRWHFVTISIENIKQETFTLSCNKKIIFYTKKHSKVKVGDYVTFSVTISNQSKNESFNHYLIKENIIATIFANTFNYQFLHRPSWSLQRFIFNQRERLLYTMKHKLSPQTFRFFSSLFLGNRNHIKTFSDTSEQFKIWGISHFLARSGLHLVLFIILWHALLRFIPLTFFVKQILIILICLIYFLLSWPSAPFIRAFTLFILYKMCLLFKIPFHFLHYLIIVCLCFLLYCPIYLFFLDFQLSFALTTALAWFNQLNPSYKSK